jgi:adenylosuccinate lyase
LGQNLEVQQAISMHIMWLIQKLIAFANKFVNEKRLGLNRQHYTTQIEHYDNLAASFDALKESIQY